MLYFYFQVYYSNINAIFLMHIVWARTYAQLSADSDIATIESRLYDKNSYM